MDNPIQVDLGRIAQDLQIRRVQVESVVQLLDEGNTVPFITRYRKERTGNLNEVVIHEIQLRVQRLRELAERKETILKAIEAQGKLHPDLATAIRAADSPKRLEDLYLPFKPKKRTKASDARERGLEPLALRVWNRDETLTDVLAAAQEFVNAEKGVDSPEKVLEGVGHILAEAISEMAAVRDSVRKVVWKTGKILTSKGEIPEGQGLEYRDYFDYSEPLSQVPPHRVLAINRGDKEGPLKVRIEVPRADLEAAFFHQLPLEAHPQAEVFRAAAIDALDRLILPSMEREVRRDLTDTAEKHAVEVFARNLRSLLLQPPIPRQAVLAIDPGLRSGCKVAVLDPHGNLLDHAVVYPHAPQHRRSEAKVQLKDLVGKHSVGVVAIGNGTACRETEELIAEIIAEGTEFSRAKSSAQPGEGDSVATIKTEPQASEPAVGVEEPAESPAESLSHQEAAPPEDHGKTIAHDPVAGDHRPSELPSQGDGMATEAISTTDGAHESLPPISGGAPESSSTDTEPEPTPVPDPGPGPEVLASSNHEIASHEVSVPIPPAENEGNAASQESAHAAEPPLYPVPDDYEAPEDAQDGTAQSSGEGTPSPEAVADQQAGAPAEAAAPADPQEPRPQASAPVAKGEGRSGAESRRGGGGKNDHGRSRGPRNKAPSTPPPPPSPPEPHPADALLAQLAYVIVNEAGASVYSTSPVGREELPDFDATLRSAISIGRRLQDPLAELVKIEPQNIGVGLYQHDVNPKQLKETLESVISSCVNFVGVDLNSASVPLLRHVSGLNQLTARRIVEFRKEKGNFAGREVLMEVEGIGPATYTQAAGFLKIPEGAHPLDRTWIHPESYEVATRLLANLGHGPEVVRDKAKLPELQKQLADANVPELAKELAVGELTLHDIIEALGRPERDPRDDLPKPIFKKGILKLEDLVAGMELKGTVLNVVDFGAFVDIGLKDSGLVHISQLANRYIKSPHDVVSVGDVVTVWVMSVDHERKRVSLTMVKPGTERHRGAQQGGGRRGGGEPSREGQGRRDRSRGPRPTGSALTSPPVGAPSIATLAESQGRRPDRDRDRERSGPGPSHGQGVSEGGGQAPGGSYRPGPGPGQSRGGPRGGHFGHGPGPGGGRPGPGRQDRPSAPGPGQGPRPPSRPSRPSTPPPPLSKEALTGSVPLRTFGQLKQLWEARVEPGDETSATPPELAQPPAPDSDVAAPAPPDTTTDPSDPPPGEAPAGSP